MRISITPIFIVILMLVFDLSAGVGGQIYELTQEGNSLDENKGIHKFPLMCGEDICEDKNRLPLGTPIDAGVPIQDYGWWLEYWLDFDDNGMDDRLQRIIAGESESESRTSIIGADGKPTVAIIIHYAWHPGNSDIENIKIVLSKHGWNEEDSWFMPMTILDNIVLDHVPVSALLDLWMIEEVVLIEQQNVIIPYLDKASKGSKIRSSNLYGETMRELGYDGSDIVIAILDTGVDNEHFSLDDFSDTNNDNSNDPNELNDPKWVAGCDATSFSGNTCSSAGDEDPDDGDGHGTHVAGIALGTGDSDRTNQGYAPGAYLVDVKVMTDAGGSNSQSILQGIQWATNNVDTDWGNNKSSNGIDIMSMSFGSSSNPVGEDDTGDSGTSAEATAVNQAAEAGIVCIAAIGNDGQRRVTSVGAADSAITVGAIDDQNTIDRQDDDIASYSNSGPREADDDDDIKDELKPWVVAPGSGITSAENAQSSSIIPGSENNRADDEYTSKDGTSMSTPAVAGLVAIMLQVGIQEGLIEEKSSKRTEIIKDYLMKYSEKRSSATQTIDGYSWNNEYGFGIIDGKEILKGMFGDSTGGGFPVDPGTGNETAPPPGSGNWVEIESPGNGECQYDQATSPDELVCKSWVIEGETYRIRGNIDQGEDNGSIEDVLVQLTYKFKPSDDQPAKEEILIGWHTPELTLTGQSITNWTTTVEIPEFTDDEIDATQLFVRVAAKNEFEQWSNITKNNYGIGHIDFSLESPSGQNEISGIVDVMGKWESVDGCTVQWRLGTDEWTDAIIKLNGNGYTYTVIENGKNVEKTGMIENSGEWSFDWDTNKIEDGTHRMSVRSISGNGVISEEIRQQITIDNIPPSPDLMFRSSALSIEEYGIPVTDVYVNTFLEIRGTIRNTGDMAAYDVGIILEEEGARRDEYVIPQINSGEIIDLVLYWNPAISGDRGIEIIIDPINTVEESDETNNKLSNNFYIVPRPNGIDLAIRENAVKTIPEIPRPNEQVIIDVRIDNLGSSDAYDIEGFVEIKTDKGWQKVATNQIARIVGQGSIQISFLHIPNESGILEVRVNIGGEISDVNWENNIFETYILVDKTTLTGPRNLNFKVGEVPIEIIDLEDGGIVITEKENELYLYKLTESKNLVSCNNILEEMWAGEITFQVNEDNIAHLVWSRRYLDNNGYYKQTLTYSSIDTACQMTPIQDLMPPILLSDGKYWGIDIDMRDAEIIISGYYQDIFTGGTFQKQTDIFLLYSDNPTSSADWILTSKIISDLDIMTNSADSLEIEFGFNEQIHILYQENRDDSSGIERLGLWYAHGELNEPDWTFKKAVGDEAGLAEMIVIVEDEEEKIIAVWREGNLQESEIVCIIADSSFRPINNQEKRFYARGLKNINAIETNRGIQLYFDVVGPNGPQIQYGLINFEEEWLGISNRLNSGQLHTSTKSPSSSETLILHTSPNGWQIRSLIDDDARKSNDISVMDWIKIKLGLANNDQEFRILVVGVSITVLLLCAIIMVTLSVQGIRWAGNKRRKKSSGTVILEEDLIEVIDDSDIKIQNIEIDLIELVTDNKENKSSIQNRRNRRNSRTPAEDEMSIYEVNVTENDNIIKTDLNLNKEIICSSCNARFEAPIEVSVIKCPVCEKIIDWR
ncbi:MAG: S8 family serine peptidase [Candidatus Thalassarchaeaceae archaeon]|nr:S8 family serine peptidase [Candidatus Thalassarchaeaceae archaeon]